MEFNENKQKLIGFEELLKDAQEKIENFKKEVSSLNARIFDIDRNNTTLKIELEKISEYYRNCKSDLDETIERLH